MPTTEELLKQAQALNEAKKYDEVIALLTDELLKEHNSADLYAEKAQAYYRIDQYELCEKAADAALAIKPNAKAYHYKGNRYYDLKNYDEAIKVYEKTIELDQKFALPYYGLGRSYRNQKKYDDAVKAYQKAIELDPKFSDAYNGLGNVYAVQKKYYDAIKAYQKAIELDPKFAYPYNGLGNIYYDQKKYEEALKAYLEAIELDPKYPNPYDGLGNVYQNQKKYEEAIKAHMQAIAIDPKFAYPYNNLGSIYYDLNNYEEATKEYQKAIEIDATYSDPYYNRALVYYDLEQYADALKDYERFIALTKDAPDEFTKNASKKVGELKDLLKTHNYDKIRHLVEEIKNVLLHKDGSITHYTSLTTAKKLILEKSLLRLSEGAFLNDTSEGMELFNFLPSFDTATQPTNTTTNADPFVKRPFIGSFVVGGLRDNLTLWRMYGKDNKEEAKGCAITLDGNELVRRIKEKLIAEGKATNIEEIDEDLRFYRVAYRPPDTNEKFSIPGAESGEQAKLNEYLDELRIKVGEFIEEKEQSTIKYVLEQLNSIAYLFKSAAYQHEFELRLVVKGNRFTKQIDSNLSPPWVYVELINIIPLIREITLGPKVDRRDEWKAAFYYGITQELGKEDKTPDIFISHLPFK